MSSFSREEIELFLKHKRVAMYPVVIRQLLEEYDKWASEVSKVYVHVTDGRLSYPTYDAEVIIAESDDRVMKACDEAVKEEMDMLKEKIEAIKNWAFYYQPERVDLQRYGWLFALDEVLGLFKNE